MRVSDDIIKKVLIDYAMGDEVVTITRRHFVSKASLFVWLKECSEGLPRRTVGRKKLSKPPFKDLRMMALSTTMTLEEIGRMHGCSRQRVHARIKRWLDRGYAISPPFKSGDEVEAGGKLYKVIAVNDSRTGSVMVDGVIVPNFKWSRLPRDASRPLF